MGLVVVGVNHRTAPLPLREKLVYSATEAEAMLQELKREREVPQALLLSTCNRTEVYALAEKNARQILTDSVFQRPSLNGERINAQHLYERENQEAVEHLFRVACGLDSMALGEQQILGQVRTAYELSQKAQTTGTILHRLASRAFKVGKRARTETRIGVGAVSVAYAAVDLARKVFSSLEGRNVLVVGAGENAELCIEHLLERGCRPPTIANRTLSSAEKLVSRFGGRTLALDQLEEGLAKADIVITTTGSPDPVVSVDAVRRARHDKPGRMLVIVDMAVPRDVEPGVDELSDVFRFDMDAIESIVEQNLARRQKEVPRVEALIESEMQNFMKWWRGLASSPVIRELHESFESIRDTEVSRYGKLISDDRTQVDEFTKNLVRKLLRGVTTEIKGYRPENPEELERLAALRRMFSLDQNLEDDDFD